MSFFPYFVCALLGVDSLRGGLAEGNRIYIILDLFFLIHFAKQPQAWVHVCQTLPLS